MKKALIILNEELSAMVLGRNTSLSYILAAHDLGYEVFLWNLSNDFAADINSAGEILVSHFNQDKNFADNLSKIYRLENGKIFDKISQNRSSEILEIPALKVSEIAPVKLAKIKCFLSEFDKTENLLIQRLEPMKQPFPPIGKFLVDDVLKHLKKFLPQQNFNCPINLNDKDAPEEISAKITDFAANKVPQQQSQKLATPTFSFVLGESLAEVCAQAIAEYGKIYPKSLIKNLQKNQGNNWEKNQAKIVFKPKDAAQSLGVFAVNFVERDGIDESFFEEKISQLRGKQIFEVNNSVSAADLQRIIEVFCFLQNAPQDLNEQKINQISRQEILKIAKELYDPKVLVQPFLEGVSAGDVRVNLLKNSAGNFYVAASCFRKSLRKNHDKKFTTAFSVGGALPLPVSFLSTDEQKNLEKNLAKILAVLNSDLKNDYKNSYELGLDFLLVGDDKNIFLGEVNHHCVGLLPLSEIMSEMMSKSQNPKAVYDYGIGLSKQAILDMKTTNNRHP